MAWCRTTGSSKMFASSPRLTTCLTGASLRESLPDRASYPRAAHTPGCSGNSPSLGFMPSDKAQRWRVAKTLLNRGNAEGLPSMLSGFSKTEPETFSGSRGAGAER